MDKKIHKNTATLCAALGYELGLLFMKSGIMEHFIPVYSQLQLGIFSLFSLFCKTKTVFSCN